MSTARYLIGDSSEVLATMPASSVDLVMCSPPFLHMRAYLPPDHPDKAAEMGSEPTPADFIDALLRVTAELGRVLAPHGSIVIELGDTSSKSGGAGGDYATGGLRDGQPKFGGSAKAARGTLAERRQHGRTQLGGASHAFAGAGGGHNMGGDGWPEAKSLCLVPELYRVALAYGINPLTGQPSPAGRWIIRNVVSWVRTNPPPGRLGDKYRRGTSTMVVATRSGDRWFDDHDARTAPSPNSHARTKKGVQYAPAAGKEAGDGRGGGWATFNREHLSRSAPPLDWWLIPSRSYRSTTDHRHYATYPERLCEIPILTMCPPRVCTWCGRPPARITAPTAEYSERLGQSIYPKNDTTHERQLRGRRGAHSKDVTKQHDHVGWAECDCPDMPGRWRPGVVLDPFAGTGTTLVVANRHGRDAIGVDLDQRNVTIARERIPHLEVDGVEDQAGVA